MVGASGIIGSHAARELIADGWPVYGLARNPPGNVDGLRPVAADLLDPASLAAALADVAPTHVFLTSDTGEAAPGLDPVLAAATTAALIDGLLLHLLTDPAGLPPGAAIAALDAHLARHPAAGQKEATC